MARVAFVFPGQGSQWVGMLGAFADSAAGGGIGRGAAEARGEVMLAGHRAAVARACDVSRRLGAKRAVTLAVSVPFHSSLLASAADRLRVRLAGVDVRSPSVPVINNVDVAVESDPQRVK